MKTIEEMTGVEKAAGLLVAIGPQAASEILKYLDDISVIKISSEIAKINRLSASEREELVGEFMVQIKKMKKSGFSEITGEVLAKKILCDAFGEEKASDVLGKIKQVPINESFDFLMGVDAKSIVDLVSGEHPQIVAVMLAHIDGSRAGGVMKLLPRDIAKDVTLRLAKMGKVSPDAVMHMSSSLKKKFDSMLEKTRGDSPGGINALAGILNHLKNDTEKRIISYFDDDMPEFAQEIRKKISVFEFESVAVLSNKEIRLVLQKIAENRIIAKALKGTDDDIKYRILRNMSTNRASDIVSLMDLMGPVRLSEVNEARTMIVSIMRELDEKGVIIIKKDGDEYID